MGNYCYSQQDMTSKTLDVTNDLRAKMESISFKSGQKNDLGKLHSKAEVLKNHKIVKKIGKGLFSKVYLAVDSSGTKVGIKVISKKNFVAKEAIEKIIIEKEILKLLDHKNILKLYRTLQTNTRIYFILEYADKGNLLNLINVKIRLTPDEIRVITAQIIEALLYIHSKAIIYGDLKAENILMNRRGTVKLCDFNLSGTSSLLNDTVQGTVSYIAPEILEGKERTPKSDFWSLGVLIHLMFYRKFPFKNTNQTELFYNVINRNIEAEPRDLKAPRALRQFICDLLVKNPKRRLGDSLKDFTSHSFFTGFDWKNYQNEPRNFDYVSSIPSFDEVERSVTNFSSESEIQLFSSGRENADFFYNIDGFTYENKELVGKNKKEQKNDRKKGEKHESLSKKTSKNDSSHTFSNNKSGNAKNGGKEFSDSAKDRMSLNPAIEELDSVEGVSQLNLEPRRAK